MEITEAIMNEVSTITLHWARRFAYLYPRWEVNELHNEAFLISVRLLERDKYKPELSSMSTFLWRALRYDIGHRYKRANAQRYLTCPDGVRRYQQKELSQCNLTKAQQYEYDKKNTDDDTPLSFIEVNVQHNEWASGRIQGHTEEELMRRGMSINEQRSQAQELRYNYEQQSKRSEG